MIGYVRLWVRFPLVILCILITLLLMSIGGLLHAPRFNRRVMVASFRTGAFLFGLRIKIVGELSAQRPLLLISNHFSYIDLLAIGSSVPAAFTPKSDIAGWPIIGSLCKYAGCVFIDRNPRKTLDARKLLEQSSGRGEIISLFPEGTTDDGTSLLPFKSSFFSIAEQGEVAVQPLAVVYTHLNGTPLDPAALPVIGWYGDMTLLPHVITFLKQKNADVTLVFGAPVMGKAFPSRKELALYCKAQVETSLHELQPGIFRSTV